MSLQISKCPWCSADLDVVGNKVPKQLSYPYPICTNCADKLPDVPEDYLMEVSKSFVDSLPYGNIILDEDGIVLKYNKKEEEITGFKSEKVEGKNFFQKVAPCTAVKEFEGRFIELGDSRVDAQVEFEFIFHFNSSSIQVKIVLTYFSSSNIFSLVVIKLKELGV
jgi:photoactive yellow protein